MINRKSTFFLGIFIFLIPFLGLPSSWKTTLVVFSGLALISLSIKITLPKKSIKNKIKRERVADITKLEVKEDSNITDSNLPDIELK